MIVVVAPFGDLKPLVGAPEAGNTSLYFRDEKKIGNNIPWSAQ